MRVFATLPQEDLRSAGPIARSFEADGYDGLVCSENKHDPFMPLAVAATQTARVELHTGITIAFARSPMVVATMGWDLAGGSGGRFVVGLGSQIKPHIERRFSVPWNAPAARMREYVQALRAIWRCWKTGEKLAYEGVHYRFTLMTPNFTPEPIAAPAPAITVAAVGPAMVAVAAEECDGVKLHSFATRAYLERGILPGLSARGAARARREGWPQRRQDAKAVCPWSRRASLMSELPRSARRSGADGPRSARRRHRHAAFVSLRRCGQWAGGRGLSVLGVGVAAA